MRICKQFVIIITIQLFKNYEYYGALGDLGFVHL